MTVKTNTAPTTTTRRAIVESIREDDGAKTNRRRPSTPKRSRVDTESFLADLDDYLQANDNLSSFTISPKHYR